MSKLNAARDFVRGFALPEAAASWGEENIGDFAEPEARLLYWDGAGTRFLNDEVSPGVLADSLQFRIGIDSQRAPESEIDLGSSKLRGLPHLPADFDWPEDHYFCAQLNLADIRAVDVTEQLPATGMLYLFFDGAVDGLAIHYDGPLDDLQVTEYPDGEYSYAEHYMEEFRDAPHSVELKPGFVFYIGEGEAYDYDDITKYLPKDFFDGLSKILGCAHDPSEHDEHIFGRPSYWQGEDEVWDDDEVDEDDVELLLYQEEFGEGHIHFWVEFDDAKDGEFDDVWLSYSGT